MKKQDPDNIVGVAAVVGSASGDLSCIVRWSLGASGNELPHDDDEFDIELEVDGTQVAHRTIKPMNYAMLDPARLEAPYPAPHDPRTWWVAKQPKAPIDPTAADQGDLSNKAIGVLHLLKPTSTPHLRFRAARVLYRAYLDTALKDRALGLLTEGQLSSSAIAFADALIHTGVRPLHLPQLVSTEFRAVRLGAGAPRLLTVDAAVLPSTAHAALVMSAISVAEVVAELDVVVEQSLQVRNHIRVAALQGGSMIDYWDDPNNAGSGPDEAARGKAWPASELIGLGCSIPLIRADVEGWVRAKQSLKVRITQKPRTGTPVPPEVLAKDGFKTLRPIWLARDRKSFGTVDLEPIATDGLKRALLFGSSHPAGAPTSARVDWGMVRVDLPVRKDPATGLDVPTESSVSFRTGDAKLEICIDRPLPPPNAKSNDERTGAAYNVYGVWEGIAAFQPFFDDPSKSPTLAELKPWLMTRRYSFAKDLQKAFPPISGHEHPNLTVGMSDPAWHPLLIKPTVVEDASDATAIQMPDVSGPCDAVFTFDLRTGMAMPKDVRPPVGWDPAAPIATDWLPEKDRELSPLPPKQLRPQRYRFWVTAVDAFEQESNPVPVRTEDPDVGEAPSWVFETVRRTPLSAPPGGSQLKCSYDAFSHRLTVDFETPLDAQVSGRAPGPHVPSPRVPASWLNATVMIYRRLLLEDKDAALFRDIRTPGLPQWHALDNELRADGWLPWETLEADAPTSADNWSVQKQLEEDDRGWEYKAAVGFEVKPVFREFWGPYALVNGKGGRSLTVVTSAKIESAARTPLLIDEAPAAGAVSTANACSVSDAKDPWWPEVTACTLVLAAPVSAPPNLRRDFILQRLLDRGYVSEGKPVARVPFGERMLTIGQRDMCLEALGRVKGTPKDPVPLPDSEELSAARRLLARDFGIADASGLRQHGTVGFRGLAVLRWRYTPRSLRPMASKGQYAECAAFRVYSIMLPVEANEAIQFATMRATLTRSGGNTFSVAISGGERDAWATIGTRPTAVALTSAQGTVYASVLHTNIVTGIHMLDLLPESVALPPTCEALFYSAQALDDVPIQTVQAISDYTYFAPIPGGAEMRIAWWVTGASAAGKESAPGLISPMHIHLLSRSIEPPPPANLMVRPPSNNDLHFLDPAKHSRWLPTAVDSVPAAKSYPRTMVSWQPPAEVGDIFLEIHRYEQRIAKSGGHISQAVLTRTPWEALQTIESLPDGSPIEESDLHLLQPWLKGNPVEAPNAPTGYWVPFQPVSNGMKVQTGVIQLASPTLKVAFVDPPPLWPTWIDYFGRNGDSSSAMDGNWEFQYRLRTYIDLGATLGDQRYLYSTPTSWSHFVPPSTPPIVISELNPTSRDLAIAKPRVVFKFKSQASAFMRAVSLRALTEPQPSWIYRVVLRRLLTAQQLASSTKPWVDVGAPVELSFGNTIDEAQIVDEEVDRGWPSDAPTIVYRVFVQEFKKDETTGAEYLVRAFEDKPKEINITLRLPGSDLTEVEVTQEVGIK